MFEWFKGGKDTSNVILFPETKGYTQVPLITPPKENNALYMIGSTDDGRVQLRVGSDYSLTLTLHEDAVAHLIKQLAVVIDHAYEVTVKEVE